MKAITKVRFRNKIKRLRKRVGFWNKWLMKPKKGKSIEETFNDRMMDRLTTVSDLQNFVDWLEYRAVIQLKRLSFSSDFDTEHRRGRLFETVKLIEDINKMIKKREELEKKKEQ